MDNLRFVEPRSGWDVLPEASGPGIPAEDLTTALEEGCGVLLVLEASRARIAGARSGLVDTEVHLNEAIGSLRQALALLREQARGDATSALADGFVVRSQAPKPA